MYAYSIKNKPYLKIKSVKKGIASRILERNKTSTAKKNKTGKRILPFS